MHCIILLTVKVSNMYCNNNFIDKWRDSDIQGIAITIVMTVYVLLNGFINNAYSESVIFIHIRFLIIIH